MWVHLTQEHFSDLDKPLSASRAKLDGKIELVKDQALENIRKKVKRTMIIDDVLEKAGELEVSAGKFKDVSKTVANKYWWENMKCWVGIGVSVVLLVIVLVLIFCKPNFSECGN